jgi:hypothetical protein
VSGRAAWRVLETDIAQKPLSQALLGLASATVSRPRLTLVLGMSWRIVEGRLEPAVVCQ